jgi:hypothetical protein
MYSKENISGFSDRDSLLCQVFADLFHLRDITVRYFIGFTYSVNKKEGDPTLPVQVHAADILIVKPGLKTFHKILQAAGFHCFPPLDIRF